MMHSCLISIQYNNKSQYKINLKLNSDNKMLLCFLRINLLTTSIITIKSNVHIYLYNSHDMVSLIKVVVRLLLFSWKIINQIKLCGQCHTTVKFSRSGQMSQFANNFLGEQTKKLSIELNQSAIM